MNKVAVMTDAVAAIPGELTGKYNIKVLPLRINVDGKYFSETEMDGEDVVTRAWTTGEIPKTSSPTPVEYLEAYRELSKRAESIICITYSHNLGISFNSAAQAKEIARSELPQTKIAVIDSSCDIGGQMLIVLEAAKAANDGEGLQYLIELVNKRISEVSWIVLFDTLNFIVKGGRGTTARPWQSPAITTKMIMELDASTGGKYIPLLKVRTKSQGKAKMLEIMKERNKSKKFHAVVCYQKDIPEEAKELREEISSQSHCVELYTIKPALVQAIHLGPGALGLGWFSED